MTSFPSFSVGAPIGGHLHKGKPKKQYTDRSGRKQESVGADLNQLLRFSSGQERLERIFQNAYGGLETDVVRVYLPFAIPEQNYALEYKEYSQGGGLQKACDGSRIYQEKTRQQYTDRRGETRYTWSLKDVDKPCTKQGPKCKDCTLTCRLTVFVEEIYQAGIRQSIVLNSKAVNDQRLLSTLRRENERLMALAPGANISTFPSSVASMPETDYYVRWLLRRIPQTTYKPGTEKYTKPDGRTGYRETGKQVRSQDWLLHMEICPDWWREAQSRWGLGPYKINVDTGKAEPVIAAYLRMMQPMAALGGMPQSLKQLLPPAMQQQLTPPVPPASLPQQSPEPADDLQDVGIPMYASNDEPLPVEVAEVVGEAALFKPRSASRETINRLREVAEVLGLTDSDIKKALGALYPERHTSELAGYHCRQVADRLMQQWGVKQSDGNGEPIFLNLNEALDHWQRQGHALHSIDDDRQRAMAWGAIVQAVPQISDPISDPISDQTPGPSLNSEQNPRPPRPKRTQRS